MKTIRSKFFFWVMFANQILKDSSLVFFKDLKNPRLAMQNPGGFGLWKIPCFENFLVWHLLPSFEDLRTDTNSSHRYAWKSSATAFPQWGIIKCVNSSLLPNVQVCPPHSHPFSFFLYFLSIFLFCFFFGKKTRYLVFGKWSCQILNIILQKLMFGLSRLEIWLSRVNWLSLTCGTLSFWTMIKCISSCYSLLQLVWHTACCLVQLGDMYWALVVIHTVWKGRKQKI